jgi:RNA polymerase sigma-70 factor (ECF subfamily)
MEPRIQHSLDAHYGVFSACVKIAALAPVAVHPIPRRHPKGYDLGSMVALISNLGSSTPTRPAGDDNGRATTAAREAAHDAALVRRFNAGDEAAFVEIVTRYRRRIFSVALKHLRDHADADEIAQDTFIRAHRGLARFRGDSSLATWLYRIAFNLSRNRHKYHFCRRRHAMLSLDRPFGEGNAATFSDMIASDASNPLREATAGEFSELVAECMEKLGEHQREILTLRTKLNRSYDDIAKLLGVSVGTVKSRIGRARENLRELLAESYPELAPGASTLGWFESIRTGGLIDAACA